MRRHGVLGQRLGVGLPPVALVGAEERPRRPPERGLRRGDPAGKISHPRQRPRWVRRTETPAPPPRRRAGRRGDPARARRTGPERARADERDGAPAAPEASSLRRPHAHDLAPLRRGGSAEVEVDGASVVREAHAHLARRGLEARDALEQGEHLPPGGLGGDLPSGLVRGAVEPRAERARAQGEDACLRANRPRQGSRLGEGLAGGVGEEGGAFPGEGEEVRNRQRPEDRRAGISSWERLHGGGRRGVPPRVRVG